MTDETEPENDHTEGHTEDAGDPPDAGRLEELKDDIEEVRRRAEDADLIPDPDEPTPGGSGESADEDDQAAAPPG